MGLRTRVLHQPYGDQALFVRKSTLQQLKVRGVGMHTRLHAYTVPAASRRCQQIVAVCAEPSACVEGARPSTQNCCLRACCRWLVVSCQMLLLAQGYKEWRLLEDYALVQQLNKLSAPVIVPKPVVTSGRLYRAAGFWEVVAVHQRILYEYTVAGTSPDALQELRATLLKKQGSRHQPCSSGT